jgi:hypothetical protein
MAFRKSNLINTINMPKTLKQSPYFAEDSKKKLNSVKAPTLKIVESKTSPYFSKTMQKNPAIEQLKQHLKIVELTRFINKH